MLLETYSIGQLVLLSWIILGAASILLLRTYEAHWAPVLLCRDAAQKDLLDVLLSYHDNNDSAERLTLEIIHDVIDQRVVHLWMLCGLPERRR